jgi:NAD(P)-dependent dehydrogenase (short-subunit alcohol dehydrogenase family)
MKDFKNKVVVVTGAGSGIGKATAIEFAKHGAKLAVNDYKMENLADLIAELKSLGTTYYAEGFDVSDKNAMKQFAENVKKNLGSTDVIMNNAGISPNGDNFMDEPLEYFEKVININFWAVVYGTKFFTPQLLENNKEAAIINISSLNGLVGSIGLVSYSSAKFAVRGFNESISFELHKSNVTVHSVHPGGVNTKIGLVDKEGVKINDDFGSKFHSAYLKTTPETMAKAIIKGVQKKKFRIVAGERALEAYLGVLLLPFETIKKIMLKDMYNKGLKEVIENKLFVKSKK